MHRAGDMRSSFVILLVSLSIVSATNILDFIYRDVANKQNSVPSSGTRDESVENDESTCNCSGPDCMCCVDFNITYIDLGGPGCVMMRYLSQSEGITVNVSYGDSLLHSEQVKGPEPKPTCMSMLANLAEVCARFTSLNTHNDGLKGCLQLEPKLLGDIQTQFNIGCFIMGPEGMKLDEHGAPEITAGVPSTDDTNQTNTTETINTDYILSAVNESAQQGLAFFENLLGIHFNAAGDNSTETGDVNNSTQSA